MNALRTGLVTLTLVLSASTLSAQKVGVLCKDGTKSAGGQGACSSHNGIAVTKAEMKVAKAEMKAAAKAAKADAKADAKAAKMASHEMAEEHDAHGAIAVCTDKTYSHAKSRQGACTGHGGVFKFLTAK